MYFELVKVMMGRKVAVCAFTVTLDAAAVGDTKADDTLAVEGVMASDVDDEAMTETATVTSPATVGTSD